MGNLGMYQWMTTIAKKVGGPKNLLLLTFAGGAVVGVGGYAGGAAISRSIQNNRRKKRLSESNTVIYTVKEEKASNEGVLFQIGDQFRVLERDGDAVLIEKLGDQHNPYFVSGKSLSMISNYEC